MINAGRLHEIVVDSLFTDEEVNRSPIPGPPEDAVVVDGVMSMFGFHPERLESHRAEVREMLETLRDEFWLSKGGGWSFLNLCEDRDGNLWGQHRDCEALCVLAIGLGLGSFPLPREIWPVLPGSVPYFVFEDVEMPADA